MPSGPEPAAAGSLCRPSVGGWQGPTVSELGPAAMRLSDSMCLPTTSSTANLVQQVHGDVRQGAGLESLMQRSSLPPRSADGEKPKATSCSAEQARPGLKWDTACRARCSTGRLLFPHVSCDKRCLDCSTDAAFVADDDEACAGDAARDDAGQHAAPCMLAIGPAESCKIQLKR